MPIMYDQWTNADNYVEKKIAVTVDIMLLTQEKFDWALKEIIYNETYR